MNQKTLPDGYEPWWTETADHLGGIYPFQDRGQTGQCSLDIGTLIEARRARGESVILDLAGIVSKATLLYLLGNRTLVQGIQRAPWMSFPCADGRWQPAPLPSHGMERPDSESFVYKLRTSLLDEAQNYVNGARTVGILLSGGMDSRVLAGVVRELQELSDNSFDVVGLTWGSDKSRDVVYARRITERFGWNWKHFEINASTLAANIDHMAVMGAEVSPLHLHAMPAVARTDGLDVVLAGSYGDSVGRAEFSGRRVTQLRDTQSSSVDRFGVIRHKALMAVKLALTEDVADSPHIDKHTPVLRRHEIEQEMHYMRRMLQACMLTIANKTRFYQMFTAPTVFGLMWGLDPKIRDDEWYRRLLPILPGNLLDIPWARTGLRYDHPEGQADNLDLMYHAYGQWLRGELREEVISRVNSDHVRGLGIFNDRGLDLALSAWRRASTKSTNSLDELLSWLASFQGFIEKYHLKTSQWDYATCINDSLYAMRGGLHSRLYVEARERMCD